MESKCQFRPPECSLAFDLVCSLCTLMQSLVFSHPNSHCPLCWESLPRMLPIEPRMFRSKLTNHIILCPIVAKNIPSPIFCVCPNPKEESARKKSGPHLCYPHRGLITRLDQNSCSLAQIRSCRSLPALLCLETSSGEYVLSEISQMEKGK